MANGNFDQSDLQQAFVRARDIFNTGPDNFDGLRPLFHPDIVYSRIHAPQWYRGLDNVITWLKSARMHQEQPRFYPDLNEAFPNGSPQGTIQHVGGTASWTRTGFKDETIEYVFTYVRDKEGAPWLLVDAHGHLQGAGSW